MTNVLRRYVLTILSLMIIVIGTGSIYLMKPSVKDTDGKSLIPPVRTVSGTILVYDISVIDSTPISIKLFSDRKQFNDNLGIPLLRSEHFFSYAEVSDLDGDCSIYYLNNTLLTEFLKMTREIRYCYYMKELDIR